MKSLESFDCWKSTPVDCINVPDGNRTQDTGDAIAEQPNRDGYRRCRSVISCFSVSGREKKQHSHSRNKLEQMES